MFRDLLSSRLIQAGLVFFVLCVGGSLLYSWHVHRTTENELGPIPQPVVSPVENKPETNTAPVDFQTEGVVNTPDANTDTPMPNETEAETRDSTEFADIADAFLPDDFVSEEEASAEDAPVSPYGFGPYPEVPEDLVAARGLMPWQAAERFGDPPPPLEIELGARVLVKLWKEGDTQWIGARMNKEGIMFIHYPNRVYVRYRERKNPDGTTSLTIARVSSGGTPIPRDSDIPPDGNIPPGIEIIDLDNAKVGIDPYKFLGINK